MESRGPPALLAIIGWGPLERQTRVAHQRRESVDGAAKNYRRLARMNSVKLSNFIAGKQRLTTGSTLPGQGRCERAPTT